MRSPSFTPDLIFFARPGITHDEPPVTACPVKGAVVSVDESNLSQPAWPAPPPRERASFAEDFRRFFLRGLATILPTLITLWLLLWVWNFLWESLGRHIIFLIKWSWLELVRTGAFRFQTAGYIGRYWDPDLYPIRTRLLGVTLAILLVYAVGVLAGNLIGKTAWRMAESGVLRIPLVRAIYPAVKQVTDFVLEDHSRQLRGSRVVAVQPHEQGIWSIGMVTGQADLPLHGPRAEEMVTVFVPSTPTAFTGYVLIVPRSKVMELPMTVEEALRLLVSGGVITPDQPPKPLAKVG
jgi:uncharacterized membrane protein